MASRAIPLIEISGTPAERGQAYGEAARAEIARSLDYYRQAFAESSGLGWAEVLDKARLWRDIVRDAAPDLLAEMDGIARGAGVDVDDVLALNARGEIVRSGDSAFARMAETEPVEGCSSFALLPEATGDGHVYCGQNWDWRVGTEATTVMVRIVQPPKPTVIMQVEAGQVGRHGVNSAGVALNGNGLDGRFGTSPGLPQPLLRRLILDSASFRDALYVPFAVRQHIATNLLFTARAGVAIDLETTPLSHRWGYPQQGVLVHGNHYQYGVPSAIENTYRPADSIDSLYRVPIIERGLATVRDAADSAAVRKTIHGTMSDHFSHPYGVCAHADPRDSPTRRFKTTMSSLVDLTAGEYRVLAGNPCEGDYTLLPWNIYDGPGADDVK
ncbi:MAG TPA: C45 family peptidase [Pseudonocardiaceae bacterium]|jgi:isopenicillin-N N-acyltransferase-like protein|nr:C45 family peptidase [Pseudonocardiaceae bacterium]